MTGLHPVVAVYSTFLNRAFDQVLMDVALHRLPVTFALDRAGVTGVDGPSHHGMWDVAMLSQVPGIRVAAPRDATRLRELLGAAVADDRGPTAVRYPTGRVGPDLPSCGALGSADLLTPPIPEHDVLLLPVGALAPAALDAAARLTDAGMGVAVADPRWIVPVDAALVVAAARHRLVVTIEDNTIGFGDALARGLRTHDATCEVLTLALPSSFAPARDRADLHRRHGVDGAGIADAVCTHRSTAATPRFRVV